MTESLMPSIQISAQKIAEMLGIPGVIEDVWTTDYQHGITVTYNPERTYNEMPREA